MSGFTYTFTCERCKKSITVTAMCGSPESTFCDTCYWENYFDKHPEDRPKQKSEKEQ